jgi:hypothetical protein
MTLCVKHHLYQQLCSPTMLPRHRSTNRSSPQTNLPATCPCAITFCSTIDPQSFRGQQCTACWCQPAHAEPPRGGFDAPPAQTLRPGNRAARPDLRTTLCARMATQGVSGKSLANGSSGVSEHARAGCWTRPDLLVWCGAPRRNRTGDPILTIDGRPVQGTTRHLAPLYRTTGGWPYRR